MSKPRRLGLFLVSRATGYQEFLGREGAQAAVRLGIELEVFSADDTAARQSADIMKFLNSHPDDQVGVIVMPVSDVGHEQAMLSLARRVLSRGAAWVVLNRDLADHVEQARAEVAGALAGLVTIDNLAIGRIQGQQVGALLPSEGRTVLCVLGNTFTSAARDRRDGLIEALASRRVSVQQVEGRWTPESAQQVVGKWLANFGSADRLDAVACQNDPMAMGARTELSRLAAEMSRPEWLSVPVLGVDGVANEGRRWVDQGQLAATVVVPATSVAAIELLVAAWDGKGTLPAKRVLPVTPYPTGRGPILGAR
jgi:ABC-type sugar transport system substrate-binding protein